MICFYNGCFYDFLLYVREQRQIKVEDNNRSTLFFGDLSNCIIENDATAEEATLFHVVGSFLCCHGKVGEKSLQIIF